MICNTCDTDLPDTAFRQVKACGKTYLRKICKACQSKRDCQLKLVRRRNNGDTRVKDCVDCSKLFSSKYSHIYCLDCRDKVRTEDKEVFDHKKASFSNRYSINFIKHLYDLHWKEMASDKNTLLKKASKALAQGNRVKFNEYKGRACDLQIKIDQLNANYRSLRDG